MKHVSHFSDFLRPRASQIKKLESFGTGAPAHIILKQVHLQFSHIFNICFNVRPATCTPGSLLQLTFVQVLTFLVCVCDAHATAIGFASVLKLAPSFNMQTSTSSATCKAIPQTENYFQHIIQHQSFSFITASFPSNILQLVDPLP